ncbi:MAG: low molecular weight phosphotyrosine protein phosphatase [Fibrobacter sp.]|nr:low molecular weight phosphotyrosine protein phosphatase [Fibrobacter sp.]MCQ2123949.1 low molecular weight phosphotyrosine protein phosphatase [Fibrobacter sp.]
MIKILFICHGNICRSPMAEYVMKDMVQAREEDLRKVGLSAEDFEIRSAATSTEEIGNPVYPPARRMLNSHGINCDGHAARQMTQRDYDHYDYIILMDRNNLRNLRWNLSPAQLKDDARKITMMMDWTRRPGDVADPWYTGNFDATWRDVNEGCDGLLNHIIANAMLK